LVLLLASHFRFCSYFPLPLEWIRFIRFVFFLSFQGCAPMAPASAGSQKSLALSNFPIFSTSSFPRHSQHFLAFFFHFEGAVVFFTF